MKKCIWTLVFGLGLFGISLMQWLFFRSTIKTLEDRTARVAYHALNRVLEHAHRMNDDLTLQEAIQGFSRAPGVVFAGVLDADRKVIAHTQPAQLGKIFTPPRISQTIMKVYPLQDAQETWGRLVLGLSGRASRISLAKQGLLLFGLNLCAWFLGFCGWRLQNRLQAQRQKQQDLLEFHNRELERDLERLQLAGEAGRAQSTFWMRQALERIPQPALFLDAHQRVAAFNQLACRRLGIDQEVSWCGRSWQDIPALAPCGDVLQRSLECPGQEMATSGAGFPAEFVSEKSPGGTWIFFH